ncbi:hypothetical protein BHM03_00052507 [Ensete ventricosum]|nr:hypothetical protein BHM03_00052507 [Ensete ventricosum]
MGGTTKIDRRWSISAVNSRLREKKGRRRRGEKEEKKKEEEDTYLLSSCCPCSQVARAPSSPADAMTITNTICPFLQIEEDILQEVIKMGFDKNLLVESLHNRIQNEVSDATVSYYLLLDNRFRAMSGYLGGDFQETMLYKTREEKYLLDLQRVSGPQLIFLDLCAAFLAQLRVL